MFDAGAIAQIRLANTARAVLINLLILLFAFSASASSHDGWKTTGWIGFEGQANTDIDSKIAAVARDFDFWMINGGIASSKHLTDSMTVSARADYRVVGYDFSGSGDPLDEIHVFRLNPTLRYKLNDKWSLMGGPSLQISAESGAAAGDSITGGGSIGAGYKISDTLSIALGVVVTSQIEDSAWLQPFVLINWGITDDLSLGIEARNSRGGQLKLGYALSDKWAVGVGVGFRRERFRLDDNGPVAISKGVGQEESTVISLNVTYKINEKLSLEGYGGTTVDGELRLENEDGDLIGKSDYDNAGYGGIRLNFAF